MSRRQRRPSTFTQTDVTRAVKGAVKAGVDVAQVVINRQGSIIVLTGKPASPSAGGEVDGGKQPNEWDEVTK